jgi:hypothetical protein
MRTDDHAAYGAFILLYSYTPRANRLIDLSKLPLLKTPAKRRSWVYAQLASEGYWQDRLH